MPEKVRYLLIDKRLNNNKGNVVTQDQYVFCCDTLRDGSLLTVKHGDGKSWRLIIKSIYSDKFYKVLIDSSGVHSAIIQHIGKPYADLQQFAHPAGDISEDGELLVYINETANWDTAKAMICLYNFNRCTGELYNFRSFTFPQKSAVDTMVAMSLCLSPSKRFLYVDDLISLWQLDLNQSDPWANRIRIGKYRGEQLPYSTYFYQSKRGRDGKIYVTSYGTSFYLDVINNPDSLGFSCHFVRNQVRLGSYSGNLYQQNAGALPNTPNFRLGKLNCPPIGLNTITKEDAISLSPNPAIASITIKAADAGTYQLTIFNSLGCVVYKGAFSGNELEIPTTKFANGLYHIQLQHKNNQTSSLSFIVQK